MIMQQNTQCKEAKKGERDERQEHSRTGSSTEDDKTSRAPTQTQDMRDPRGIDVGQAQVKSESGGRGTDSIDMQRTHQASGRGWGEGSKNKTIGRRKTSKRWLKMKKINNYRDGVREPRASYLRNHVEETLA